MILEINPSLEIPIYTQIVREIISGISKGEISPGDELPSVRSLSKDLGINLHTVNKAYQQLKALGFLEIDRRVGTKVSENIEKLSDSRKETFQDEIAFILTELFARGYEFEEINFFLEDILKNVGGKDNG